MEFLAPSFTCLLQVRLSIERGLSVREALKAYLQHQDHPFARNLARWQVLRDRNADPGPNDIFKPPLQRAFVSILARGLRGEPVLSALDELEDEMRLAASDCLERHLQRLPVLMVLPLVLCIFPAVMLILLGPIVGELLAGINS